MNNKKHSITASAAAVLAALIATAAVMSGCGGNNGATADEASAKETRVVTETQVVTRVVDGYITDENGEPIKDENGKPIEAVVVGTDANGEPVYGAPGSSGGSNSGEVSENSGSSSANSGNSGNSSSSSAGGSNSSSGGSDNSSSSGSGSKSSGGDSSQSLAISGKTYSVGDKVTCTYQLTSTKLLSNFQAEVRYDNKCLKATNAYLDGPAKSGSVINYELYDQGKIKFNGINLNGYNYTKGAAFLVVEYEVVGGGSTTPEFVWVIATDIKDNALVKNETADSSLTLSESYS